MEGGGLSVDWEGLSVEEPVGLGGQELGLCEDFGNTSESSRRIMWGQKLELSVG